MRTVRLRVTMRDVVPRVERTLDVPAGMTLAELHEVLPVTTGRTDSHLPQFRTDEARYTLRRGDRDQVDAVDERGVRFPRDDRGGRDIQPHVLRKPRDLNHAECGDQPVLREKLQIERRERALRDGLCNARDVAGIVDQGGRHAAR